MADYHYWIVAEQDGKPILIYGARDEAQARMRGLEMLSGINFDLERLPTRDLHKASSMIRGSKLDKTHNLDRSMQRQTHERGLKQKHNRRRFYL